MQIMVICAIIILGGFAVAVTVQTIKDGGFTCTQVSVPVITAIAAVIIMKMAVSGEVQTTLVQAIVISLALIIAGIVYTRIENIECDFKNRMSTASMFFNLLAIIISLFLCIN